METAKTNDFKPSDEMALCDLTFLCCLSVTQMIRSRFYLSDSLSICLPTG